MTDIERDIERLSALAREPEWKMIDAPKRYHLAASLGLSQAEAARALGVSCEAVRLMADRYEIRFRNANPTKLAPARRAAIRAAIDVGMSKTEIADATGMRVDRLSYYAGGGKILTDRQARVKRLLDSGLTMTETAAEMNITPQNVMSAIRSIGLTEYRRGKRGRAGRPPLSVGAEDIARCAESGMTRARAASEIGVTYNYLCTLARAHGIMFGGGRK